MPIMAKSNHLIAVYKHSYFFKRAFSSAKRYYAPDRSEISDRFSKVMRNVPQPVVVVTSALYNTENKMWQKRGVTCSSFNSISLRPSIVSFAIRRPSRMHSMLLDSDKFAIHVLAKNQVAHAVHFSKVFQENKDQFHNIPHELDDQGIPIIRDTNAVLICQTHSIHTIGDHHVWYGEVQHSYNNTHVLEPLLYFSRTFRSIGDETFIQAFEDTTLPFEDWTHEAHVRMAWNYITEYGPDDAVHHIKNGIKKYNERNKDKIARGYHETVTQFYIRLLAAAIRQEKEASLQFEEFISKNEYLLEKNLLFSYYSDEQINKSAAKQEFLAPDKKPLPLG